MARPGGKATRRGNPDDGRDTPVARNTFRRVLNAEEAGAPPNVIVEVDSSPAAADALSTQQQEPAPARVIAARAASPYAGYGSCGIGGRAPSTPSLVRTIG